MTNTIKKDEVLKQIIDVIQAPFENKGFCLKGKCFFESEDAYGNLQQYAIDLNKRKGYFGLHLSLSLFNKPLLKKVNVILEKALKDESSPYDKVLDANDIKLRLKQTFLYAITDWKRFKDSDESFEDFSQRFKIWFAIFDDLDEIDNWKEQLLLSVDFATQWFLSAERNEEWIIANTEYPALYLLKEQGREAELQQKYEDLMPGFRLQEELKLFYHYLTAQ